MVLATLFERLHQTMLSGQQVDMIQQQIDFLRAQLDGGSDGAQSADTANASTATPSSGLSSVNELRLRRFASR